MSRRLGLALGRKTGAVLAAAWLFGPIGAGAVVTEEKEASSSEVPEVEVEVEGEREGVPAPSSRTWHQANPPGFGSFSVGPFFMGYGSDLSLSSETETLTVGTLPPITQEFTSAGRDFSVDGYGGGVEGVMGLPTLPIARGVWAYPAVSLGVGAMDTTIESKSPMAPSTDFEMSGDALILGTGAGIVLASPEHPFYFDLDYNFAWQQSNLEKQPCAPSTVSSLECSADVDTNFFGHWLTAQVGWSQSNFGIHAGVGYMHGTHENDITTEQLVEFTKPPVTLPVRSDINQDLTRETVEGVFGIDGRFGRFFARAETRFTGTELSGSVKISVVFGRAR